MQHFRNLLSASFRRSTRRHDPRLEVEELEPRTVLTHGGLPLSAAVAVLPHHSAGLTVPGVPQVQVLAVPGQPGQTVPIRFTETSSNGKAGEMGLFLVDDAAGHIGGLKPGDGGYAALALSAARAQVLFTGGQAGAAREVDLPAGQFFGLYLIRNGTRAAVLARNPFNRPGHGPAALFSFANANPDHQQHLQWLSAGDFGWSDRGGSKQRITGPSALMEFGPPVNRVLVRVSGPAEDSNFLTPVSVPVDLGQSQDTPTFSFPVTPPFDTAGPTTSVQDTLDYVNQIYQDQAALDNYLQQLQQTQSYVDQIYQDQQQLNDYLNSIWQNS
jgi:hypothetical protein